MASDFYKRITLRLHDLELIEKLGKDFEEQGRRYRNRNEYLEACIRSGLEQRTQEASASKLIELTSMEEIGKAIDELMGYLVQQFQTLKIDTTVLKRLVSSVYHMTKYLSEGLPAPSEQVEEGLYDELPERFDELLCRLGNGDDAP